MSILIDIIDKQNKIIDQAIEELNCIKSLLSAIGQYNDNVIDANAYYSRVDELQHSVNCAELVKQLATKQLSILEITNDITSATTNPTS